MHKRHWLIGIAALLAFLGGMALFRISPKDAAQYAELLDSTRPTQKGASLSYSQQERKGVCKEVWLRKADEPVHVRILSDESALFFFNEGSKIEVVEEMNGVRCVMQEELFFLLPDGREVIQVSGGALYLRGDKTKKIDPTKESGLIPMQHVRYFEAVTASYNYNTQLFLAENVKLWRYRLPGHDTRMDMTGQTPLMSGTAESVEFSLDGDDLNFAAHHLQAKFDTKGGYR